MNIYNKQNVTGLFIFSEN